jgi:hypothetical protein
MPRMFLRITFSTLLVVMTASLPILAEQDSANVPAAPVPTQILAGKKVFISNASGENASAAAAPDLAYNELYAALKSWGRYELVGAPADAELIFEIRYVIAIGAMTVASGNGASAQDPEIILVIRDPKTHVLLWAFNESLHVAKKRTGRQAFDATIAKIVEDAKALVARPVATAAR